MIRLTKAAAEQIRLAAEQSGAQDMALRIAARINDKGELEFGLGFDQERNNDSVSDHWGVTVLVNAQSAPYLNDITLDYGEIAPGQMGFLFTRPSTEPPSGGGCGSGGCHTGCGTGGGCG